MTQTMEINLDTLSKLFGSLDVNVKTIESYFGVRISIQADKLEISGEETSVEKSTELVKNLILLISKGENIDPLKVKQTIDILKKGTASDVEEISQDVVTVTSKSKSIKCKTLGQRKYVRAIDTNTVVFGIGPAGTGKTYLAVAKAYDEFKKGNVEKIILTRPALEAGEKLGFLPGDLQEKVDPYLRPLYDALGEMFGIEYYPKLMEKGAIEVAPLAYMRGRTLSHAVIILDEAQNTTQEQMKMFLTRLGEGSKMIITGDDTQIDLSGKQSSLKSVPYILKGIDGIAIIKLDKSDVVRSELVQQIIMAYERAETPKCFETEKPKDAEKPPEAIKVSQE
jgi:phosphate starvation-inducible PhoH-like protein